MITKSCPLCETNKFSNIIYPKKLKNTNQINFAARRKPDNYHYAMLRCTRCNFLYAGEIYEDNFSNELYSTSDFDYEQEIDGLKKTYSHCIRESIKKINSKKNFLDIGCGNGFMLEEALRLGFKNVEGVEVSQKAIKKANPAVKNKIFRGIFNKANFNKNYYNLIFIAQVATHVTDINKFLKDIHELLSPGGSVVCVDHNEGHFLAKLLKTNHPIICDAHVQIFNKDTIKKIFQKHNYIVSKVENLKNFYRLNYWLKMIPLHKYIKRPLEILFGFFFPKILLGIKAGNIYLIANKN